MVNRGPPSIGSRVVVRGVTIGRLAVVSGVGGFTGGFTAVSERDESGRHRRVVDVVPSEVLVTAQRGNRLRVSNSITLVAYPCSTFLQSILVVYSCSLFLYSILVAA